MGERLDMKAAATMRQAFSLVELLVVIGIVVVFVGLAIPSLCGVLERGQEVRSLTTTQQNAQLLLAFCGDNRDAYPIADGNAGHASTYWYEPLIGQGYAADPSKFDPQGVRRFGYVTYWMSMCMVYDPDEMLPGKTVPPDEQFSTRVYQHQVVFPSYKGVMFLWRRPTNDLESFCCAGPLHLFPVAFADMSVQLGTRRDFSLTDAIYVDDNNIGSPVRTTWGGFRARDKRKGT
ncbi:MAG: hypothetical protein IT435_15240 [Phycisphaerales bacterium]|nr:hypothetical protein [Phycisphaerales bacterium]